MATKMINYPRVMPNNPLEEIFNLQKKLLEHYIPIEGMPNYPMNIETKKNQALMKNFLARGIEELSEACQCYREIFTHVSSNSPGSKSIELLHGFNEEVADALHFFIEALIFAGIEEKAIKGYYTTYNNCPENEDTLAFAINEASLELAKDHNLSIRDKSFRAATDFQLMNDPFLIGGHLVSMGMIRIQSELMWEVTYQFNLASNCLKNRPWYRQEIETEVGAFQHYLMSGFRALMQLLSYHGYSPDTLFIVYYHKNIINQERIKSSK